MFQDIYEFLIYIIKLLSITFQHISENLQQIPSVRSQPDCSTRKLGQPKKKGQPIRSTHKKVNPYGQPKNRSTHSVNPKNGQPRGQPKKRSTHTVNPKQGQPIRSTPKQGQPIRSTQK